MRFLHVLRHEVVLQFRSLLLTAGGIAGAVTALQLLRWARGPQLFNIWGSFGAVMILAGVLITLGAFGDMRDPRRREEILLRPAAAWEKVGAKVLVSTVIFAAFLTVAYAVASLLALGGYLLLGGQGNPLVFLDRGRWIQRAAESFWGYLPVQAIFTFGAVYFRRNPLGRTLLAGVAWLVSYVLLGAIMVQIVFLPYLSGRYGTVAAPRIEGIALDGFEGSLLSGNVWARVAPEALFLEEPLYGLFNIAVVLICWGLAVLRFRETQG
ncbi:hypothetical protein SAMN05920897_10877 [Alkalispirochaeta americana]|uniref:ABC-2 family transporter protein n=1 Tax=Alkalispirochaeta americana TaxID=159291 RepID=A0A1N6SH16_9SPIO|nr:hypothetical protein [Alkalispirochaeta americana]SIQ40292.1 hypothetical protein SAMN05920897_10877 [Alkalispirochaeta americana]